MIKLPWWYIGIHCLIHIEYNINIDCYHCSILIICCYNICVCSGTTIKNLFGGLTKKGRSPDIGVSWPEQPASGYVPLTPCPTRSARLPGTEALKKSISSPSLHSLLGFVTDNSRWGRRGELLMIFSNIHTRRTSLLPALSELDHLKVSMSPTLESWNC